MRHCDLGEEKLMRRSSYILHYGDCAEQERQATADFAAAKPDAGCWPALKPRSSADTGAQIRRVEMLLCGGARGKNRFKAVSILH